MKILLCVLSFVLLETAHAEVMTPEINSSVLHEATLNTEAQVPATQTPASEPPTSQTATSQTATIQTQAVQNTPKSTQTIAKPFSRAALAGKVVTGLLLVLGLIVMFAWAAKKFGYGNFQGQGQLRVLASLPLGNREKAVLIEVHGKQMLLGVAPGRVNFLQQVEPQEGHCSGENTQFVQAEACVAKGQDFAGYLKTLLSQGKKSA
ncbi:flagellar biosynthetic protein FliO [Alteromonadaceae bacterium 2753L.S.0a.02]|nr:flagellar biosynthetic protein FliO [Alteromonadaceae bacterium 2753L.S.0a.02]